MGGAASRLSALVVDPDPESCLELKAFLAGEGCRVTALGDLAGIREAVRSGRVQLVLLDLPEDADEAEVRLAAVRACDSDLCVIALAEEPTVETALAAMRHQAFEYLPKPVEPDDLRRTLDAAIREKGLPVDLEQHLNSEIGRRVRRRRSEHELTLKQVANRTGLSVSLISQIELGKSAASLSSLYKLARALHVEMTFFFETV